MILKILLVIAIIALFVGILFFNWFWDLIVGPMALIVIYDMIMTYRQGRQKKSEQISSEGN